MTNGIEHSGDRRAARPARSVAVITSAPLGTALDRVLDAVQHDVVSVESVARAYSHIKRVRPDLVILWLADDDVMGCQVLSMLALDNVTSRIPVLTFMAPAPDDVSVHEAYVEAGPLSLVAAPSLN